MKKTILTIILAIALTTFAKPQDTLKLSLDDVIQIASAQSIDAFRNKNMYLSSYWEFRYYKADRLPSLSISSNLLNFDRSISNYYNTVTEKEEFISRETLTSDMALSLSQNVALTGGRLFLQSKVGMLKNLAGEENTSFSSTPISIGFSQELNGYNQLKWRSKIEPLKFEKAKKSFIQDIEDLNIKSTSNFFSLINAQIQRGIAETNLANADTLYKIGQGRYQVGTVTQDELLKMELDRLNSEQSLSMAKLTEQRALANLNSFLGLDKKTIIKCIVPSDIPNLQIDPDLAIAQALENNPEILNQQQQMLQQDENVARAKSDAGINTTLDLEYGLNQKADVLVDAYKDPGESQRLRIGLSVPIIDWGRQKGRLSMAKSNREVELATLRQERIDFEMDIMQSVLEFNLQAGQVANSAKADTIAQMGYNVTFQRFLIGKIDVIKLNIASNDQENSRMAYLNRLRDYWTSYFRIRSITLFDFENKRPLIVDYDKILEN